MTREETMDKNYEWYLDNYKSLYGKYPDEFLVINNQEVKGHFKDLDDAYTFGVKEFGLGDFLLQKCESMIEVLNIYGVY